MTATGAARQVHESPAAQGLARAGIAARGLVWLVVSLLTVALALGSDQQADQAGALRTIADQPLGRLALALIVVCFAGLALFLLLDAAVGHRRKDGKERWGHRAKSFAKALLYAALAASTARFVGGGGSEQDPSSLTARLLDLPVGRLLTGIAGAVLVALGAALTARALRSKHREKLDLPGLPAPVRGPVVRVGTVGLVGRGLAVALLGVLVLRAAISAEADQARGLDQLLHDVAGRAYGQVLLLVVAVGMLAFALWSFAEAAWSDLKDGAE